MITLEKIDQVVERTGVSYQEAKDALESCNANVVEAIIFIEKQKEEEKGKGSGSMRASDLLETLREFIRRGNVSVRSDYYGGRIIQLKGTDTGYA